VLLTDNGLWLHGYGTGTPELTVKNRALRLRIFLLLSDEAGFFVAPGASKYSDHRQQKL